MSDSKENEFDKLFYGQAGAQADSESEDEKGSEADDKPTEITPVSRVPPVQSADNGSVPNSSSPPAQQTMSKQDMLKALLADPDMVGLLRSAIAQPVQQVPAQRIQPVAQSTIVPVTSQPTNTNISDVSGILGNMKLGDQFSQFPAMSYAQTNIASSIMPTTHAGPSRGVLADVAPRSAYTTFNQKAAIEKGSTFMPPPALKFKNKVDNRLLTKAPDGGVIFASEMRIDAYDDEYAMPQPELAIAHYVENQIATPPAFALVCDIEKDISGNVKSKENGPIYTIKTGLLWYTGECVSTFYIGGCILKHIPEKNQTKKLIGNDREISYYETYVYIGMPIKLYMWIKNSLGGMGLILDEGEKDVIHGDYYYSNYNVTKDKHIQWSLVMADGNVANDQNVGKLKTMMNSFNTNFLCDIYADFNVKRQGVRADGSIKFTLSPSIKSIQLINSTTVDPPNPVVTVTAAVDMSRQSDVTNLAELTKKMNARLATSDAIQAAGRMGQRQNVGNFVQAGRYNY